LACGKKKRDDSEAKVPMPRHSFSAPMEYRDLLHEWFVSGASIFDQDRFLLHPGTPERMGFLFSTRPIMTSNFEIVVHFRVTSQNTKAFAPDQSFAVWYVGEDAATAFEEKNFIQAANWTTAMHEAGYTLSGYKAKFEGIGAVLSIADSEKNLRPVVSFVKNDGKQELAFGKDLPSATSKAIDFRNTMNNAALRIRFTPTSIEGHMKQSPSLSWQECFKMDSNDIPVGGYIGVTAWTGTPPAGEMSDTVAISQIEVHNFDETSIGEDMQDVSAKIQEAYREMLTDENRHFVDQKSQMEHLQRLHVMLSDHLKEASEAESKFFLQLSNLNTAMSRLDSDCRTLSKEFSILVNPAGGSGAGALKDEIIGLRRALVKDSTSHRDKVEQVTKKISEVKEKHSQSGSSETLSVISKQSESLEKTVETRSSQMSWLLFCLIGCVVAIGVLMWNRMRYYEKKHFI